VGDARFDEADGPAPGALKKLDRVLEEYRTLWSTEHLRDLYAEIEFNRARLLTDLQDSRSALPVFEESLSFEQRKAAEFYGHLGSCHFQAEKWDQAKKALKPAWSGKPSRAYSCLAHYYLARIF
jgi:tetratricopeptide (TPR) repeat protein